MIDVDIKDKRKSVESYFEKGAVSDLMYSDNSLNKVKKIGSEIKDKLALHRVMLAEKLISLTGKLNSVSSEITEQPEDESLNGHLRYCHKQIYKNGDLNTGNDKMRQYNNIMYKKEEVVQEIKYINTLMSSIDDSKKYDLPLKLASDLGF